MARIYNSELSKELVEGGSLQQSHDKVPQELAEKVVPVMEVNPKLLGSARVLSTLTNRIASAPLTAYTSSADKDTYITGIAASYIKDVNCDVGTGGFTITCVQNGQTLTILNFPIITLTLQNDSAVMMFDKPLKIDASSAISFSGSYTAGVCSRSLTVIGFEVFNPKA